jgi:hypothetical protein
VSLAMNDDSDVTRRKERQHPVYRLTRFNGSAYTFALHSHDGSKLLNGAAYGSRKAAEDGIGFCRECCNEQHLYIKYVGEDGKHYFRLEGLDGKPLGRSEPYDAPALRDGAIQRVAEIGRTPIYSDESGKE